jgi:protein-S-isoprenylcysteine O-methyltransferase Ste14
MNGKTVFDKRKIKYYFAPVGVAVGLTVFITAAAWIMKSFRIGEIGSLFPFVPVVVFVAAGILCVLTGFTVFAAGFIHLGRIGAVGQSEILHTDGVYRIIRNPMYAGVCLTLIGAGLLFLKTGAAVAGLLWLGICTIQCKREEKELTGRFGEAYLNYKQRTPMFFPRKFR